MHVPADVNTVLKRINSTEYKAKRTTRHQGTHSTRVVTITGASDTSLTHAKIRVLEGAESQRPRVMDLVWRNHLD